MSALLQRREFVAAALSLLGGVAVTVGCGGGAAGLSSPTPAPNGSGNVAGAVADNHPDPHTATITAAQLGAGAAVTLNISNSRHSHTVTLSDAEVIQIAAKSRVSATSSTTPHSDGSGPHSHMVTLVRGLEFVCSVDGAGEAVQRLVLRSRDR
jgi:hypothetical protein